MKPEKPIENKEMAGQYLITYLSGAVITSDKPVVPAEALKRRKLYDKMEKQYPCIEKYRLRQEEIKFIKECIEKKTQPLLDNVPNNKALQEKIVAEANKQIKEKIYALKPIVYPKTIQFEDADFRDIKTYLWQQSFNSLIMRNKDFMDFLAIFE